MNLPAFPRTEYLLDASLESMHTESIEWLKEIDFWRDEMTFFYKLLHRKETKKSFPTQEVAAIEKDLIYIEGDKLNRLKKDVQHHEQLLSSVLQSASLQEEERYRKTHREILIEISNTYHLIRKFKTDLFSFIQKY